MHEHQQRFILSLLAYAVQRGVAPDTLCARAGISFKLLKQGVAPALTPKQWNDLWHQAAQACNDPLFGLHFGESLQLAALGVVGQIIQSSRTVGEAVTIANSFTPLITDVFTLNVSQGRKTFTLQFLPGTNHADESSFVHLRDFLMVFALHELDGFLLVKITPVAVKLAVAATHAAEYERVLRAKPVKKGGECLLEFDKAYWDEPILTANYELQNHLLQKLTVGKTPSFTVDEALKPRIETYLLANAYLGILSLEDVASNFNMSPRSLQRKLKDEGVTFQQLADAVRKSLAIEYINKGAYPVKEISHMLGYNELSAFSRAFKRWTGKPPVGYS